MEEKNRFCEVGLGEVGWPRRAWMIFKKRSSRRTKCEAIMKLHLKIEHFRTKIGHCNPVEYRGPQPRACSNSPYGALRVCQNRPAGPKQRNKKTSAAIRRDGPEKENVIKNISFRHPWIQ